MNKENTIFNGHFYYIGVDCEEKIFVIDHISCYTIVVDYISLEFFYEIDRSKTRTQTQLKNIIF